MPWTTPTLSEIVTRIETDFESRVTGASVPLLRRSVLRVKARVYGGAIYLIYQFLNFLKDQLFATTADTENLEIQGAEFGITRKAATYAVGNITCTGTAGTTISEGTQLQTADGQVYAVDGDTIIGSLGTATVAVTATISGTDGNQAAGATLTFVTPIIGVTSTAIVATGGLEDGLDEEDDEDLRDRILTRKRQPPHGGAEFDYEMWALEVSGVTRAWSFPQHMGMGTVGVAFVRDDDPVTIIPNTTQIAEVKSHIIEHTDDLTGDTVGIPIGAQVGLFMITLIPDTINWQIDIYPNTVTVQNSVTAQLESLIIEKGGPGETIYENDQVAAINNATGIIAFRINTPGADLTSAVRKVPTMGDVVFGDY